MKIDLRKLYAFNKIEISEDVLIPKNLYESMNILEMEPVNAKGIIKLDFENNILINLQLTGAFIMPCAVTLDSVRCPFNIQIDTSIRESDLINDVSLDLLSILWENIVLEVPLRVVKEGVEIKEVSGEGWQFEPEDEIN